MIIYDKEGVQIIDIIPDDSTFRNISIMSDDSFTLYFKSATHIEIPVGSYILYKGERYTLWKPENLKKVNSRNFEYTLLLGSNRELLKYYKFKNLASIPYELKFPLTAKPHTFIELLVSNLNLHDSGWSVGECIVSNDKLISFNHEDCLSALSRIAQEFNTEWNVEGKRISLCKIEKFKDDPVSLAYGRGNGFVSGVARSNEGDKSPVGVLYVQGGDRNIDFSKYKSKTLLLPKNGTLEYEGKTYKTDKHGMFITQVDNPNTAEDSYDASNIYPKRVGTVSEVIAVNAEKNLYDFKDISIPENLDYSKHRIGGEKATVIFQSGILAGREFDIQTDNDKLVGYVHSERRFKLVPAEQDGIMMPGGVFVPKVGDEYAVFHIALPDAYVCDNATQSGASWDMFKDAVRYFHENSTPRVVVTGELDPIFAKKKWGEIGAKLVAGGHILCGDNDILPNGEKIRIIGVKEYFSEPHSPVLTLSNTTISGSILGDLGRLEAEEVTTDKKIKETQQYTSRNYASIMETLGMMFDPEGDYFTDIIKPLAVHTAQLVVGTNSGQFDLVDVLFKPNLNNDARAFSSTKGKLVHYTINEDGTTRTWNIKALGTMALNDNVPYYVYARCKKEGTQGSIVVIKDQIKLTQFEGFYHFWVGTLGSISDNVRSFQPKYGVTEMSGKFLTTGVVKDALSRLIIDLENAKITAKDGASIEGAMKFLAGSSGYENLSDKPDLSGFEKSTDVEYLKNALKGATDIIGGLVLAHVIAAKNTDGKVRSYQSGLGDVAFASGVENFGKADETRKAEIRHDGQAILMDAIIKGTIEALKGRIGGYKIENGSLVFDKTFTNSDSYISPTTGAKVANVQSTQVKIDGHSGFMTFKAKYTNIPNHKDSLTNISPLGIYAGVGLEHVTSRGHVGQLSGCVVGNITIGDKGAINVGVFGGIHKDMPTESLPNRYGGWFDKARVNGLHTNVKVVLNTSVQLTEFDDFIYCKNTNHIAIRLPDNPQIGKTFRIKQCNTNLRFKAKHKFFFNSETHEETLKRKGAVATFVFDGTHWQMSTSHT